MDLVNLLNDEPVILSIAVNTLCAVVAAAVVASATATSICSSNQSILTDENQELFIGTLTKEARKRKAENETSKAINEKKIHFPCYTAHQWVAITNGSFNEFESLKGKLVCGDKFKTEILEAIR